MKRIILIPTLFVYLFALAQPPTPPGSTKVNQRYDWLSGKFGSLTLPAGTATPTTYGGPLLKGNIFWDSTGKKSRIYDGTNWRYYPDSVYVQDSTLHVRYGTTDNSIGTLHTGGTTNAKLSALQNGDAANTVDVADNTQTWRWNTLGSSSGTGLKLSSSSASSITNTVFGIDRTGSNASGTIGLGLDVSTTATGANATNIAGRFSASGALNNYGLIVALGNVGIGNQTPAASSILDLTSTSQGFLAPRMNTTQQNAISSPANGLTIYNTDSAAYVVFNGSAWLKIGSGGGTTAHVENFSSVSNLRASSFYTTSGSLIAKLQGYNVAGDGGGTEFYWDGVSGATDDGVFVVKPTGVGGGAGRWLKIFNGKVRALEGGVKNDGTDQRANLNTLFSNATVKEVVFDNGTVSMSGRLDLPDGKYMSFENGAKIKGITGSNTDTLDNVMVRASYYQQIFDTTITVRKLKSAGGSISVIWFGAVADCLNTNETGTTDNYNAFRRAIISMYDTLSTANGYFYSKRLYIPASPRNKTYYCSKTIYIGGQIEIYGDGIAASIINWPRGVAGLVITNTSYGNTAQFANPQGQAAYRCSIHDLTLSGYKGALGFFSGYYDAISHGLTLYAGSTNVQHVQIMGWQGDGVRIFGANENYLADVETDYCAGNGFNFLTADGNANALYRCVARWSGKYGFHDASFLGNFAFNCNSTTNGGHYSFNRTAITDGGKFWYAKRNVVWRVYHNGHHYTCILAHNSGAVDAEPGVGSLTATYWTDNGVGSYNNQWINWELFEDYNVGAVHPGVTAGWQTYYDSTIDFTFANNVWNDSTQYVGGGAYYMEGANQTGNWIGLYTEFDQVNGYNNSNSYVAFGNGGAVILGATQNGWSQKWGGGYMSFPNVACVSQNNQANPNNERWWAVINGSTGASAATKIFGWLNSQVGVTHGWSYDSTNNNITYTNINALSISNLITSVNINNSGTYLGTSRLTQANQGSAWNETTPGKTGGSIHLYPTSGTDFGSAITFGAPGSGTPTDGQAGIYTHTDGGYGTKMYLATTNNFSSGSKTHLFIDYTGRVSVGDPPTFSPTAMFHLPAGTATASTAPLKFTSGSAVLLTTPEAGAEEVDANGIKYYTKEATAGRGYVPDVQRFRLTSDGSTISTIANFFGSTSNPTLVSGAEYIIEIDCYYTNTTAGTVTWTFTNSAAPTSQNIHARFSPVAGIVAPAGSAAATYLEGDVQGDATATKALTTSGTLTDATTQWAHFSIHLYNGTGTSLKIQATKLVGGTITPLKGSYWTVTRVPAGNTGIFVN